MNNANRSTDSSFVTEQRVTLHRHYGTVSIPQRWPFNISGFDHQLDPINGDVVAIQQSVQLVSSNDRKSSLDERYRWSYLGKFFPALLQQTERWTLKCVGMCVRNRRTSPEILYCKPTTPKTPWNRQRLQLFTLTTRNQRMWTNSASITANCSNMLTQRCFVRLFERFHYRISVQYGY